MQPSRLHDAFVCGVKTLMDNQQFEKFFFLFIRAKKRCVKSLWSVQPLQIKLPPTKFTGVGRRPSCHAGVAGDRPALAIAFSPEPAKPVSVRGSRAC